MPDDAPELCEVDGLLEVRDPFVNVPAIMRDIRRAASSADEMAAFRARVEALREHAGRLGGVTSDRRGVRRWAELAVKKVARKFVRRHLDHQADVNRDVFALLAALIPHLDRAAGDRAELFHRVRELEERVGAARPAGGL